MKHIQKNNSGFTLIEMMLSCALLIILVNVGVKISLSAGQISAVNALAKDRLLAVQEIDSTFRDAVRGASGVMDSAGAYKTSDSVTILRMNDPKHIRVIGTALEANRFSVLDLKEDSGEWKVSDLRSFPLPLQNVQITTKLQNDATLLNLSYFVKAEHGERMKNPMRHSVLAKAQCGSAL